MDQKLFFMINREWTSPGLDLLMAVLSSFDFWMPLLSVLIVFMAAFGGFKARAFLVTLALIVAISDPVVDNGLKRAVNRPRPTQVQEARVVDFQKARPRFLALLRPLAVRASRPDAVIVKGNSFPSGHVMNNFAAAVVLSAFFGRRGWPYFLFAAGVGYSRIYTAAHWPSDVLASVFLGLGVGLLGVATAEAVWARWGSCFAPVTFQKHPSLRAREGAPA